MNNNNKLFIRGLPLFIPGLKNKLQTHFSCIGPVKRVVLFRHNRGVGPLSGTGLVEYHRPCDALDAIKKLNNEIFEGKFLSVSFFRSRNNPVQNAPRNNLVTESATPASIITSNSFSPFSLLNGDFITKEQRIEQTIKNAKRLEESQTLALIKKKFTQNISDNVEILDDYYKLSLICPMTKTKLAVPSRGFRCEHLECFDLKAFITLNYNNWSSLSCPICKKDLINVSLLMIDAFFLKILFDLKSNGLTDVHIDSDGNWFKITEKSLGFTVLVDNNLDDTITISDSEDEIESDHAEAIVKTKQVFCPEPEQPVIKKEIRKRKAKAIGPQEIPIESIKHRLRSAAKKI